MKQRIKRRPMAEINVVQYIDVMLVLLVIFMITAPLLSQGVDIDLPKAEAQVLSAKGSQPVIVTVDKKGRYFLNSNKNPEQALSPSQLSQLIASELQLATKSHALRTFLVKGDATVDYGRVINAMVLMQQAGVEHVGLLTEPYEKTV